MTVERGLRGACPMMAILRKAGFQDEASPAGSPEDLPARS